MSQDRDSRTTIEGASIGPPIEQSSERATIVVFGHDDTRLVELAPGDQVLVGRAPPSDVVIDDLTLSRRHAHLRFADGTVEVVDLGSRNGTFVRGSRVERATLRSGDDVQLGNVMLSVQIRGAEQPPLGIFGYDALVERVADEVIRARTFGQEFSLVGVFCADGPDLEGRHVSRWATAVRACLRPVDLVAVYGPHSLLVLMPQCPMAQAERAARKLVREVSGPRLLCGIAEFPRTAKSADELLGAGYSAARAASFEDPVRLAESEHVAEDTQPVVRSPAMHRVFELTERVAANDVPVLILGETGTGKEVIAGALHRASTRASKPLQVVNCAALPSNLIESSLFGHEKGAFTGAESARKGVFEEADGGTVFLDEIGELSPGAQAALLRVLETKRFNRVGSTREIEVDVRIVAATHRDLERMSVEGTFRADLLYRLNTLTLRVPPLRERPEEIEPLAVRFLNGTVARWHTQASRIAPRTLELLRAYAWPGNVRELRNVVERAAVICGGDTLEPEDLPERLRRRSSSAEMPAISVSGRPQTPSDEIPNAASTLPFKERVKEYEVNLIRGALREAHGNQSKAANLLQMPLRTLVHKIKAYGLKRSSDGD